jgi:hypothetical protein
MKKHNIKNFNLMEYGLHTQSISVMLAQQSLEELVLFKPHLEPLIEELKLLDKATKKLNDSFRG